MSNRRRRPADEQKKPDKLFIPTDSAFTLADAARVGFGNTGGLSFKADSGMFVEDVDIFSVIPDPAQPRRAMPSSIRAGWNGDPQELPAVMFAWQQQAEAERGNPLDLEAYLAGDTGHAPEPETGETLPQIGIEKNGYIEQSFLEVVRLAGSIRREGLMNPVTVTRDGEHFIIETGERRYLAYHLLNAVYGGEDWVRIPAQVVEVPNLWRQAAENNARVDLNAIARARQFSLLLMDLLSHDEEKPMEFQPFEAFENEQGFYAQVGDTRPPRGKAGLLLEALNAQTSATLTRCRKMLGLPYEVWQIGDDLNLPEDTLLKLAALPADEAIRVAQKLFESKTFSGVENGEKPFESKTFSDIPVWQKRIDSTFSPAKWQKMDRDERQEAYQYLKSLLVKLEALGI